MNKKSFSYLGLTASLLVFGTIGIFRRYIPLPSSLLACLRGLIGGVILIVILAVKRRKISPEKWPLLVLCGACMGANWIFLFEAYNLTSIATATLCYYMAPTFIVLLSPLVLKEKLTPKKLVCAGVSLAGMAAVSGVFEGADVGNLLGVLLSLGGAVLYAAVILMNKTLPQGDSFSRTAVQLLSAFAVLTPYVLFTEDVTALSFDVKTIVLVLLLGIVHTGLSYALYFTSIARLPGQTVAVLSYLDPVSALFFSAIFLGEGLSLWGILGAVCILGSALISERK